MSALKWGTAAAVWGIIALMVTAAWFATDLPDLDDALKETRRPAVAILAADDSVLFEAGDLVGTPVTLENVPPHLAQAVIATEDRRFVDHFGLDVIGLARAMVTNLRAGRIVQGGSTLTQQLAKNLFLTPAQTFKRKFQEVLLALWLEYRFSKEQILTLYLNRVYLGAGTYGVDAAARRYFGKPAAHVSLYEAALIAGLLKAPSRLNPLSNPEAAHARTQVVLGAMADAGYLSAERAKWAGAQGTFATPAVRAGSGSRYFVDWVLDRLPALVPRRDKDLIVRTTLDPRLQRAAERAIQNALASQKGGAKAEQAALLALTPAGAVRAMVGGRDYGQSKFNRVTQARRQPGSAFKPIVYLAALEAGLRPSTRIEDAPIKIGDWQPENSSGKYAGPVRLDEALARSLNTVAVRLAQRVGPRTVAETAKRLGITGDLPQDASLALGTGEVSLLDLTSVYAVFANGGSSVWAYGIEEIRDSAGGLLYGREGGGAGRLIERGTASDLNGMLARALNQGTGRRASLDRPAAGKTGTTQDFRDAWFLGFTRDYVTGVWFGNDDSRSTKGVTGGGLPARTWRDFMAAAHQGAPSEPLVRVTPASSAPEEIGAGSRAPAFRAVPFDDAGNGGGG